ncbi:MAG: rhodanese-like domain-containing protein [Pseudomonadota bacterium]
MMKKSIFTKFCTFFAACAFCLCTLLTSAHAEVKDINVDEALALVAAPAADMVFLDVRMPFEFENGHIENAIHIDYYNENFVTDVAELDKNKTYVVYCRSGVRGGYAMKVMEEQGFENVYNVAGGYIGMYPEKTYDMPSK